MSDNPDNSKKHSFAYKLGSIRNKWDKGLSRSFLSMRNPSPAPGASSDLMEDNWVNTWYHLDRVLEMGKNAGEVAGPASAPLRAVCGILQTLVRVASVRRYCAL